MAIVGCGLIASRWVRTFDGDPRIQVAVLIDPDHDTAAALAKKHSLQVPISANLNEALSAHQVDAVANLTPICLHAAVSRAALEAGLHVLSEKPLALRLDDAVELVRRANDHDRVLAVMQNHGQDLRFGLFRDHLHAASSPPYAVTAEVFVPLHAPGFRTGQDLPATTDLAVHAFDQIRRLITAPPVDVHCSETPAAFLDTHCSVTTISVRFADASLFTYRGGFTTGTALRTPPTGRWQAEGTGGGAAWDGERTVTTTAPTTMSPQRSQLPQALPGYQLCLQSMIDALHGATAPKCHAVGNLGTIALLDAAVTSARLGCVCGVAATHGVLR